MLVPITPQVPTVEIDESLEALLGESHAGANGLYFIVLLIVLGGLCAAVSVRVDVDVRAPVTVRPATERQTLRAMADGAIERVGVSRGQVVAVGDTILLLRSTASNRAFDAALISARDQRAFSRDLRAMLGATDEGNRLSTVHDRLALQRSRASLTEADVEWRQLSADVHRTRQTAERLRQLAQRGFAVPAELESAELELTRAQESRALALDRRRARWSSELAEAEQRSRDLGQAIAVASTERANRAIVTPISGTVEELTPVTRGSVLRAGDVVATISPDTTLVAEALLSPRDVGWVRRGMTVRLLIEGYGIQEWGAADGIVTSVGRDYTIVHDQPVFHVRVRLRRAELRRPDGHVRRLTKGLRGQARFIIARRTIGQMLLHRAREWVDA